jgi:phosphatidylinositol alpha-mannosyltransferase
MVSPYDLSVHGGVQGQVSGLAAVLRTMDHEVVVVTPGRPVGDDGCGTVRVGGSIGVRANGSVAPVSIWPTAAARAARVVRRPDIDVVHLHEPLAPVANYGCLLAGRQPIVGTFHRNGASKLYRALGPAARWAARRLASACAVSDSARDNASSLGVDFEVLFNGVDVDRFATGVPTPTSGPTVLFVGRHEPRKGLSVLLEAFSSLQRPAVLWVAGEGAETEGLRRRYPGSPTLHWLGAISDDEKVARLAGADVFCAPSRGGESFGMVLLEAMAAGCALVASDIDGYRDAADGRASFVPPGDPAALAVALIEALADSEAKRGLSSPDAVAAGRSRAEEWSMGRLARRYVEIYERVLADASARGGSGPTVA